MSWFCIYNAGHLSYHVLTRVDSLGYMLSWLFWLKAGFLVSKGSLLVFSTPTGLRALHSNQCLSRLEV